MADQKSRIEIALHRANTTGTLMPTLGERLFHVLLTAMTVLRQFAGPERKRALEQAWRKLGKSRNQIHGKTAVQVQIYC